MRYSKSDRLRYGLQVGFLMVLTRTRLETHLFGHDASDLSTVVLAVLAGRLGLIRRSVLLRKLESDVLFVDGRSHHATTALRVLLRGYCSVAFMIMYSLLAGLFNNSLLASLNERATNRQQLRGQTVKQQISVKSD